MLLCCGLLGGWAGAGQLDIPGPAGSGQFGQAVTVLPNGNFVVTDPGYDAPGPIANVGAVYLYNGVTLAVISTLTGSTANDQVGYGGVTVLTNGNFVVRSPNWDNGAATDAGAVTWGSGTSGVAGVVSAANSLVGSTAGDHVGSDGVTALNNGNYVVSMPYWDNGAATDAGAVTWGNGTTGIAGVVSAANSLVGAVSGDQVGGSGVTALNNGNYVVSSLNWNNGAAYSAGAVTWGSGTTGITGAVSAANSLVGSTVYDYVGVFGVTALNNGNYVVRSPHWDNGAVAEAGAATWGSGTAGVSGPVTAINSLVGSTAGDQVGASGVTALNNGHYVVSSYLWDNGATADVGAVTWGSGSGGTVGAVSAANSLVGTASGDQVGRPYYGQSVNALSNGNYVVSSVYWRNGAVANAGAVTWGNGLGGTVGAVSATNSLVGSTAGDQVGGNGVTALNNGNYVVSSVFWHNGAAANAGAVTWGSGLGGTVGAVSAANSLVGSTTGDLCGYGTFDSDHSIVALNNGNFVVRSDQWRNGATAFAGAVTWCNGLGGTVGPVTVVNSLVGSTANDRVGVSAVIALNSGNYVVSSRDWRNGAVLDAGAVTWGNGLGGTVGAVSAANSLVGSQASDWVGSGFVMALANGNYVVSSPNWDNGLVGNAGAVTWGSGTTGVSGPVSAANSLVGSQGANYVGYDGVTALNSGNYVVSSHLWDNGVASDAGAVSMGDGTVGTTGAVAAANSVLGTVASGGGSMNFTYDLPNTRLLVGYPAGNRVSLFSTEPEIAVERPAGTNIPNGGTNSFGNVIPGANSNLTFTIKNTSIANLTGLTITTNGTDAAMFTVTSNPTAPVSGPNGSTTFTVQFAPTSTGAKTAAIHIASNDGDENPFDIALTGTGTPPILVPTMIKFR
jgi:hypothetical protein